MEVVCSFYKRVAWRDVVGKACKSSLHPVNMYYILVIEDIPWANIISII